MELRQLVYLDAVIRYGGFTRAAEQLRIAQPAISAQIKNLERELGIDVLHRTTRTVRLTTAGAEFLQHARLALAHVEEARAVAQAHREVQLGHLRLGTTPVTGGVDVIAALSVFRARHPGVTVALDSGLADPLLDRLRDGALDLVVAPAHHTDPADLDARLLVRESLVLITPPTDTRKISSLRHVLGDSFVCLPRTSGLRRLLDQAFARYAAHPNVDFETPDPSGILDIVAAGLGSALVAASVAARSREPIQVHRLPDLPEHPPIYIFTRRQGVTAIARAFIHDVTAPRSDAGDTAPPTGGSSAA